MKIEAHYYDRTFGNGENAKKYKVTISQSRYPIGLSVQIRYDSPCWGQTESGDSAALVSGGSFLLPATQAAALATAMLSFLELSKNQPTPPPLELILDEDTLESISVPSVKVSDLARKLGSKSDLILKEAQKHGLPITESSHYLTLEVAKKISEKVKEEMKE